MKNFNQNLVIQISALFILLLNISCSRSKMESNEDNNESEKIISVCAPEHLIDLELHPVPVSQALNMIKQTTLSICTISGNTANVLLDSLDQSALNTIKNIACELMSAGTYSLTGIKIWFAYSNQNFHCFYEPVKLWSSETSDEKKYYINSSSRYFKFDNNQLVEATGNMNEILYYQDTLLIKNPNSTLCRKFNNVNDSTGDIKAVVYPTQLLDTIMLDSKRNKIKFWSYIYSKYAGGKDNSRHSILMSCDTFDVNNNKNLTIIKLPVRGNIANHANPCPPQCEFARYSNKKVK